MQAALLDWAVHHEREEEGALQQRSLPGGFLQRLWLRRIILLLCSRACGGPLLKCSRQSSAGSDLESQAQLRPGPRVWGCCSQVTCDPAKCLGPCRACNLATDACEPLEFSGTCTTADKRVGRCANGSCQVGAAL